MRFNLIGLDNHSFYRKQRHICVTQYEIKSKRWFKSDD